MTWAVHWLRLCMRLDQAPHLVGQWAPGHDWEEVKVVLHGTCVHMAHGLLTRCEPARRPACLAAPHMHAVTTRLRLALCMVPGGIHTRCHITTSPKHMVPVRYSHAAPAAPRRSSRFEPRSAHAPG
jgi:hypothetical protein